MEVPFNPLKDLYESLKESDCIVLVGSGRSYHAMAIPASQLAMMKDGKIIVTPGDVGFPGANLYQAAPTLEKRYERILILVNSGSGETIDPYLEVKGLRRYIEETKTEKFNLTAITSNPNSPIGKIAKEYGNLIELKGRVKSTREPKEYSEEGVMGDMFELGSCTLLQALTKALYESRPAEEIPELLKRELSIIGEIIDKNIYSETSTSVINILERGSNVYGASKGTGDQVAKMSLIRLHHIKHFLGDNVYVARGINTPRPRAGDIQISVSYSGETETVVAWERRFKELGGYQLSITANKESTLYKESDFKFLIEEKTKPGEPRNFYLRSAYLLSALTIRLLQRLKERGISLPESLLKELSHSITE